MEAAEHSVCLDCQNGSHATCWKLSDPLVDCTCESHGKMNEITLEGWWNTTAKNDLLKNLDKIKEYGAVDLEIMGTAMEKLVDGNPLSPKGIEMAICFYLLGKIARAVAAFEHSDVPTDDTYYDITFYSMMARRVRETGQWP